MVIVGGGPAGLSAGLLLGRCGREVLICDNEQYRNRYSQSMHGFLSRDGIHPAELRKIAREQMQSYPSVTIEKINILQARRSPQGFQLLSDDQVTIETRMLLLATGLRDRWPEIEGAKEMYGKSIFHCPYCDAWEVRNQPLAVLANGDKRAGDLALELKVWSQDIVIFTDGPSEISSNYKERLSKHQIPIYEEKILSLEGTKGLLESIVLETGEKIARKALFFNTHSPQRSDLANQLGCEFDENGGVIVGKYECTNIPGLFVAGDASRELFQAIVAASEGVGAAFAINTALTKLGGL